MKELAADLTGRMGPEKPFSARSVGSLVERLRLEKTKTRSGVCVVWSNQTKRSLDKLARRYGIDSPEAALREHVNVVNVGTGGSPDTHGAGLDAVTAGERS